MASLKLPSEKDVLARTYFPGLGFKYCWLREHVSQWWLGQEFEKTKAVTKNKTKKKTERGKKDPWLCSFVLSTCLAAENWNRLVVWGAAGWEAQSGHVSACHMWVRSASVSAVRAPTKHWQVVTDVWENEGHDFIKKGGWTACISRVRMTLHYGSVLGAFLNIHGTDWVIFRHCNNLWHPGQAHTHTLQYAHPHTHLEAI